MVYPQIPPLQPHGKIADQPRDYKGLGKIKVTSDYSTGNCSGGLGNNPPTFLD